jgi:hypothetical protein
MVAGKAGSNDINRSGLLRRRVGRCVGRIRRARSGVSYVFDHRDGAKEDDIVLLQAGTLSRSFL